MKTIFVTLFLLMSFSAFALTKAEIKQTLDQMKATGMFSEAQIKEAEKELSGMNQSDIDAMVEKGKEHAKDPEFQKKVQQMTNDPKFQEQVKKAAEQMKTKKNN